MSSSSHYRRLSRRLACENRLFDVFFDSIETPGGELVDNYLIVRPKIIAPGGIVGVCVLPEIDSRIGLMRGYRHQLDDEVWQAPAGFIEPGETAERSALRELAEETGLSCQAADLCSLGTYYPDAGLVEGKVALFAARNCVAGEAEPQAPEVGTSTLQLFDRVTLWRFVKETESVGGSTLVACMRYLQITSSGEKDKP